MYNTIKNFSLISTIIHCIVSTILTVLVVSVLGVLIFGWGMVVDVLYDFGNIIELIESAINSLDNIAGAIFISVVLLICLVFSVPILLLITSTIFGFVTYYKYNNTYMYNLFMFSKKFKSDAILKIVTNILLIAISIYNMTQDSAFVMCVAILIFVLCLILNIIQLFLCKKIIITN